MEEHGCFSSFGLERSKRDGGVLGQDHIERERERERDIGERILVILPA